jgi:hypothetical protein
MMPSLRSKYTIGTQQQVSILTESPAEIVSATCAVDSILL